MQLEQLTTRRDGSHRLGPVPTTARAASHLGAVTLAKRRRCSSTRPTGRQSAQKAAHATGRRPKLPAYAVGRLGTDWSGWVKGGSGTFFFYKTVFLQKKLMSHRSYRYYHHGPSDDQGHLR